MKLFILHFSTRLKKFIFFIILDKKKKKLKLKFSVEVKIKIYNLLFTKSILYTIQTIAV